MVGPYILGRDGEGPHHTVATHAHAGEHCRVIRDSNVVLEHRYGVGDVANVPGPGAVSLSVEVVQKFGASYNIKIEYQR